MKERWKDIKGFEGYYRVSNLGRIESLDRTIETKRSGKTWFREIRGRILKQKKDKYGYLVVGLSCQNKTKSFTVHRLVALNWIKNIKEFEQVNHIDGVKTNNTVDNLEWCTAAMNTEHARINNLLGKRPKVISNEDISTIISLYKEGLTAPQISKRYKYHSGTVSKILKENYEGYYDYDKVRNDLKISWKIVDEIRELHTQGVTGVDIAYKFKISKSNVSLIVNNKTWVKND